MLTGEFRPGSQGSGRSARVVDSYFRIWYYARVKWATPILVTTKRCFSFHAE